MGWRARRNAAARERAELAQLRQALRLGRKLHGGTFTVVLPADLSTSPAVAAKTGATLDDLGREHLEVTLPGDCTADPEAAGRYSPAMLLATIRKGTGAAIRKARLGLTPAERDDLAAEVSLRVWALAGDRLGSLDDPSRLPRFGALADSPAADLNSQRAHDVGWVREVAGRILAEGSRGDRAGWQATDSAASLDAETGGDPAALADALREASDLARDDRAEDDAYLKAGREADRRTGQRPGAPATVTLRAAAALPAGKAGERAILAALCDHSATAGDHLAAEGRPTGKSPRKDWRKSARQGSDKLADLAARRPVGMRALAAGLALIAGDGREARPLNEAPPATGRGKVKRPPLRTPTDGQAERMRRVYAATSRPDPRQAWGEAGRDAIRRDLAAQRTRTLAADERAETERLLAADLARLLAEAPGD